MLASPTGAYSSLVGQRRAGTPAKPQRVRGLDPAELTPHASWRRPTGQETGAGGARLFCPPPLGPAAPRGTCGRRRSPGSFGKRRSGELCGAVGAPRPTVVSPFQSSAAGRGLNAWAPVPQAAPSAPLPISRGCSPTRKEEKGPG